MNRTKDISQLAAILTQNLGVHKNNCETVIDFTIAMQKARTVNLSQMVNYSEKLDEIKPESIYKNYQRLIQKSQLSQSDLAKCILSMYELEDCKLTLSLDRTNWRYGTSDINLLVLSVCLLGTAIPLYWLELDTKGNSNTEERIQLVQMFVSSFGADKIGFLVADREFVGNDWFNYLDAAGINFGIRIKSNMQLELNNGTKVKAGALFKSVSSGGMISHQIKIDGMDLLAQATRSIEHELVIVVSNNLVEPNLLVIYAKRWRIECLFGQLKTRGFNFEDTHFTIKQRVGNLMKFLVLSFAICYLIGLVHAKHHPILIKKHGRKLKSFFRHGYDLLIRALNSNFQKAIKMIVACFSTINLAEKCQQLVCVLY